MDKPTDTVRRLRAKPPRIWLVIGDKLGDNSQIEMIAGSLGLACDVKHLVPRQEFIVGKPRFRASLEHLDPSSSDTLSPPWPNLVITAGRRHAMVALWIKQQSPGTKLVLVGRPRRWIDRFDLVITPPQYRLPDLPQVMRLSLPLMRTAAKSVSNSADEWAPRLESLARPIIAVLIGNATQPFRFDAGVIKELIMQCSGIQSRYGGSLYFSTSRRTSPAVVNALKEQLPEDARLYEWQPYCHDNPYLALLGHADYFIVSGDSVSMMVEVADRGKPLAIFQLPVVPLGRIWRSFSRRLHSESEGGLTNTVLRRLGKRLYRTGLVGFSRDLTQIHTTLIAGGFAVHLGESFNKPSRPLPNELGRIRERILALLSGV